MIDNAQAEEEERTSGLPAFSPLSILRTIWKRKIRITVAWVLFTVCAVAVVRLLPPVYLAETVVLVDSQKIPEKFVSATVADDLEERIASIRQMLLSGAELKKVIEEFGLYREERKTQFEEEILELMRKDITITLESAMPGSNGASRAKRPGAFRIGYQGSDRTMVMQVANRLTDLYVEQNLKTREGQAAGTSDFLETQLRDAKKHLDEMEATVSAYKLAHNGELPQQENTLSGTLSRLQIELEANRDAINRAQQTKVILESSANAMESNISAQSRAWEQVPRGEESGGYALLPGQSATSPVGKASEALEVQLILLRSRFSESHPDVIRLRKAVENVKRSEAQKEAQKQASDAAAALASAQPANAAAKRSPAPPLRESPEFARTREQLAGLRAQIKGSDAELENRKAEQQRILRDLDVYQRRIERLPVREQEMAQITRDYEMSKENYKSLLDKKMAAEMSLNMERRQQSERFVVLDRAQLPEKPIKPKKPALYAGGAGVGLVLALLVGFGAELRKNVLLGEWELPAGTPILARLPYIEVPIDSGQTKSKPRGWFSRRKELASATATSVVLAKAVMTALYAVRDRL
jgi:polysaccharide chain length determinant protein (PEP-CTERM system associated)